MSHCKNCGNPAYACDCGDDYEEVEPAVNFLLNKQKIPADHPFRKNREQAGLPMFGEEKDGDN
jgi:hypothetical protein